MFHGIPHLALPSSAGGNLEAVLQQHLPVTESFAWCQTSLSLASRLALPTGRPISLSKRATQGSVADRPPIQLQPKCTCKGRPVSDGTQRIGLSTDKDCQRTKADRDTILCFHRSLSGERNLIRPSALLLQLGMCPQMNNGLSFFRKRELFQGRAICPQVLKMQIWLLYCVSQVIPPKQSSRNKPRGRSLSCIWANLQVKTKSCVLYCGSIKSRGYLPASQPRAKPPGSSHLYQRSLFLTAAC